MWKPKTRTITFRVTDEDYKLLETLATKEGMKLSRFMDEKVTQLFLYAFRKMRKSKRDKFVS